MSTPPPQPPTITGINPSSGPTNGNTPVLLTGTNLSGATSVSFGGVSATPTSTTATTIAVLSPARAAGPARVVVTTPGGSSTQPVFFTYVTVTAPVLASLSPSVGPLTGGGVTTITGSGLAFTTGVTFATGSTNVRPSSFAILSDNQLAVIVPPGSGPTAQVSVTNAVGPSATTLTYTYTGIPPPVLTTINPTTGPAAGGNQVVLTGTGFTYTTQVAFGTGNLASFSVTSDTTITATAPPGPGGPANVTVTGPGGTSSPTVYTYVGSATPAITNLTPNAGPISGGNTVTITGSNLANVTSVLFGTISATSFTVLSSTAINVIVPAAPPAPPGPPGPPGPPPPPTAVTVQAGSLTSNNLPYSYVAPPVSTAVFPAVGIISGGTSVVIIGNGFQNTSSIQFGSSSVPITNITVSPDGTQINTISPPHPIGTVPIVIATPRGTDSLQTFAYQAPPIISSLIQSSGPITGGTTVSITGGGLFNTNNVYFGAVPATSFLVLSDTLVTAVSPPQAAGVVSVTIGTPAAFSNGALFQYVAVPTLTTISPTNGSILGGNNVTLTGTGFTTTTNVFFGLLPTTFSVLSDTQIAAKAPLVGGIGPIPVSVQNAGGISAAQTYTYRL